MAKRKRDSTEAYETPLQKKNKIRTAKSEGSAASKRQERSERNLKERKKKSQPTSDVPELVKSSEANQDTLATGQDFISLNDVATTPTEVNASGKKKRKTKEEKKADGVKRKAAKEAKAADKEAGIEKVSRQAAPRFIVFVGNMPWTTTTQQIEQHFKKLTPKVRHSTDKVTKKSKGFAFLEFDDYSKMKTCLKVYHHSIFDPERTARLPESALDENGLAKELTDEKGRLLGRRINVELTAGGGGKGAGRKDKIVQKNTKLFEERERRKKEEMKQQRSKNRNAKSAVNTSEIGSEAIHPSRMNRVK